MPNWTKEQNLAITEEGNNILVSAGAGSGKTAVLSERVIRKVKDGIDIDHILILTFTRPAAYEMASRIREKLIKANLPKQVELLDKAYITTFDSFSLSIVKKYHDKLNINGNTEIIDKNSIDIVKSELLDEVFDEYYKDNNELFIKLINDFCLKDDKQLKKYILKLNNDLDLRTDKITFLKNYISNYYSDEFINNSFIEYENILINKINNIKNNLNNISSYGEYYDKLFDILKYLLNSKDYKSIKENNSIKLPNLPNGSDNYLATIKETIKKDLDYINELTSLDKDTLINNYNNTKDYLKIITEILIKLDEKIVNYKRKYNAYEFIDIAKLAIDVVKNNPDIREELTNYFNEIMIDEYQDTSDIQDEFIKLISKNNVYMVGDIKQSIYRFRNANPNIFKNKYLDYSNNKNGIKIDLNKNFRSRNEVLDNINKIFNSVMSISFGGADYLDSHQLTFGNDSYINEGKTTQNYNLEIKNYNIEKDLKYSKDEIEAFIIANDIKNKIDSKYQIFNKDDKVFHDANYNDFVILLDRATKFDLYKKIFEYMNIPLTLLKDIDISNQDEVYLIKNILNLIECVNNKEINNSYKYAYMSIARSYLFRLSDNDIFNTITNNNYENDIIINKITNIVTQLDILDLKSLINTIIEEFNFYEKMLTVPNISERITVLESFINMCDTLSSMNYDYHMFALYLTDILNDTDKKIEVPVSVVADNSVRIMTIHKSKGLEYPICYYAGISNGFNINELKDKIMYDNKYGIIVPSYKEEYNDTFIKDLVKRNYYLEEISEKIRLFYVALTRSKEKMIMIANLKDDEVILNDELKEEYRSFLDILNSVKDKLKDYISDIDLNSIILTKDYLNKDLSKKLGNYEVNKIDVEDLVINNEIVEEEHYSKTVNKLITKEEKDNMAFGTKIHEIFEIIDFNNPDLDIISDKERKYITNLLNQDILKNIKEANIIKEYEFYNDNKHGIIDLMLEYNDHIDIIDYKLKHIDDTAYLEQLTGYKEYISKKTNKDVNIYLYSILDNNMKEM